LHRNDIGPEGAEAIAEALVGNKTLIHLKCEVNLFLSFLLVLILFCSSFPFVCIS
jgi:hypothetical protein